MIPLNLNRLNEDALRNHLLKQGYNEFEAKNYADRLQKIHDSDVCSDFSRLLLNKKPKLSRYEE